MATLGDLVQRSRDKATHVTSMRLQRGLMHILYQSISWLTISDSTPSMMWHSISQDDKQ